MKKIILAAIATTAMSGMALSADLPSKKAPEVVAPASVDGFDFAFGMKVMSDYISRGISQSDRKPSATAYGELRYNIGDTQLYAGVQPWLVRLPTNPAAELDLYAGVRQTWGKFSVDVGGIYYDYPNNKDQYWSQGAGGATVLNPVGFGPANCAGPGFCATTAKDPSFLELYFKPSYNITDSFNVGGNVYWSPNWNNYKFTSTYLSGTAKYTFGETGFSVSGEYGRQFLGSVKPNSIFAGPAGFKFPSYNSWNLGASYAWKQFTVDLRYYGSDLNKTNCYFVSSDPAGNVVGAAATGRSNWCGQRFMASLAIDLDWVKDLKK